MKKLPPLFEVYEDAVAQAHPEFKYATVRAYNTDMQRAVEALLHVAGELGFMDEMFDRAYDVLKANGYNQHYNSMKYEFHQLLRLIEQRGRFQAEPAGKS